MKKRRNTYKIVLQKWLINDVIELLEEYNKIESDYYDEVINKTPVKDWGTLSEKAPFKAHKLLKAIRYSLKPEFQKHLKSLFALEYELEERHRRRKERALDTTNQINKY